MFVQRCFSLLYFFHYKKCAVDLRDHLFHGALFGFRIISIESLIFSRNICLDASADCKRTFFISNRRLIRDNHLVTMTESIDWLIELCRDVQLEQFAQRIREDLQITRIQHFDFVTAEDLEKIGIARPAAKRLLDAVKKCKGGWRRNLFTKILPEKGCVVGRSGKSSPVNTNVSVTFTERPE